MNIRGRIVSAAEPTLRSHLIPLLAIGALLSVPTQLHGQSQRGLERSQSVTKKQIVDQIKADHSLGRELARQIGRPGAANPLGLQSDTDVARATVEIGRRLKVGRDKKSAREFFLKSSSANQRLLKNPRKLNGPQHVQLLLQQARLVGFELGDPAGAKPFLDLALELAPDDERGHVIYDQLSARNAELFPPVVRYPQAE